MRVEEKDSSVNIGCGDEERKYEGGEDITMGRMWAGSEKVNCEVSSLHPLARS